MPAYDYQDMPLIGQGTTLGYKTTAVGATYTTVVNIVSFDSDFTVGVEEYTLLSSTAVRRRHTIVDNKSLSGSMLYKVGEPDIQQFMLWTVTPQKSWWKVTLIDGTSIEFAGVMESLKPKFENGKIVMADFSIAIDGPLDTTLPALV